MHVSTAHLSDREVLERVKLSKLGGRIAADNLHRMLTHALQEQSEHEKFQRFLVLAEKEIPLWAKIMRYMLCMSSHEYTHMLRERAYKLKLEYKEA